MCAVSSTASMMSKAGDRRFAALGVAGLLVIGAGCASSRFEPVDPDRLEEGIARLSGPLPRDVAALYDLDVRWSGGLRLTLLATADAGRFAISEAFGSALSITVWSADRPTSVLDFDVGCRQRIDDVAGVAGVGALPVRQAARLLGGRLPAVPEDRVSRGPRSTLEVRGAGWAARVLVQADPWRVVEVRELRADGRRGWRVRLAEHDGSVPGRVKVAAPGGRRAELALKRIEWSDELALPGLPELPRCVEAPE